MMSGISPCRRYLADHAIDPDIARKYGVELTGTRLRFPIVTRDGERFIRTRDVPSRKVLQPKGIRPAPWWPAGHHPAEFALICEGEADTLAALSVIELIPALASLAVVALPGALIAHPLLLDDLKAHGVRAVYLALDADDTGRKGTGKLGALLTEAGIACLAVELPEGWDLSDLLTDSDDRTATFLKAISGAEIFIPPTPSSARKKPATGPRRHLHRDDLDRALDDLRAIPAAEYLEPIAGVEPLPGGRVRCPLPEHEDRRPSASFRGVCWYCHRCGEGGDLLDLAATISGLSLTGDFLAVATWAAERLNLETTAFGRSNERGAR